MTANAGASPSPTGEGEAPGGQVVYATEVVGVGPLVGDFLRAGVLVLFGEQAPAELHDFSVLHRPTVQDAGPRVGDVVELGEVRLPVLAVGDVVADNLLNLGHLDLKADGRDRPAMPGDVCVPRGGLPELRVGHSIRIVRPAAASVGEERNPHEFPRPTLRP